MPSCFLQIACVNAEVAISRSDKVSVDQTSHGIVCFLACVAAVVHKLRIDAKLTRLVTNLNIEVEIEEFGVPPETLAKQKGLRIKGDLIVEHINPERVSPQTQGQVKGTRFKIECLLATEPNRNCLVKVK